MVIKGKCFIKGPQFQRPQKTVIKFADVWFEDLHHRFVLCWVLNRVHNKLLEDMFDDIKQVFMVGFDEQILVVKFNNIFLELVNLILFMKLLRCPFTVLRYVDVL
jgi:hypothetical protein